MYEGPDAKRIVYLSLATWPLSFAWALLDPGSWWVTMYWLPLSCLVLWGAPALWYIVRYIPNDIRHLVKSHRQH